MISEGNLYLLKQSLLRHEGFRSKPYKDTVGKMTIGIGRNLDDVGITKDEAFYLLNDDINTAIISLNVIPFLDEIDQVRQCVLIEMCFNMGINRLLQFKNMLSALEAKEYDKAANEMLDSKWAKQVGERALHLAFTMRSGRFMVVS